MRGGKKIIKILKHAIKELRIIAYQLVYKHNVYMLKSIAISL